MPPHAQPSQIQLSSRGRRHLADASRLVSCPTDPIQCEAPLKKPKEPSATRDQPVSPVPVPWAGCPHTSRRGRGGVHSFYESMEGPASARALS